MRLHRLEVEGFGPFRSRQIVDFDSFADDGIFLIAGRTGAGKSSILDAVCFGLYGGVPRYDGGEKRLRSDHSDPDDVSEVVVEFSTPTGRFRVTRSPEYLRPAKRGGGLTKQAAGVSLDEWTDAGWIGRSARAVDVANDLDEILQLSREQFLQVILLAQNRFSEFLLANSKDRQTLLRRLFGTQRFEDVQARFDERRRAAEQSLGARTAAVTARLDEAERLVSSADLAGDAAESTEGEQTPDAAAPVRTLTTEERLDALRRAQARAGYRAERRASERDEAEKHSASADAALAAAREARRDQVERDRARASLELLDAGEAQISEARDELANARSAEILRAPIQAATRAAAARADAAEAERSARSTWELFGITTDDLDTWVAQRTAEIGAWQRARILEDEVPTLRAELQRAEADIVAISARMDAAEVERAAAPTTLAALTVERDEARRAADRAPDLLAATTAAEARRAASQEAARLDDAQRVAEHALAEATAAHADAQSALARLRARRLDGFAGELAAGLSDGDACPVCGSQEHPSPAPHTDPVSAADIEDAERLRDEAAQRERDAAATTSALRAELAAATARADGRTAEQAEAERDAATAAHAESIAAAEQQRVLDSRLQELAARTQQLEASYAADSAELASARETRALLVQRSTESEAAIADARGDAPSVAERIEASTAQVATARSLADTIAELARREAAARDAADEQQDALAASAFADAPAAEAALRSGTAQAALDARITEHAVRREKERAILLELELRMLPDELIDLAPVELAAATARSAWTSAVDEAARAAGTAERLDGLIESAASEHARTADEAAAFETIRGLADTIAGRGANTRKMTLETFVLAAELEEIVEAANRRLGDMSTGRYQLQHSDALAARGAASGLGIVVFDAFTGQSRPAQSLSGGETFLSSLALALGLAEVVTARAGGIRLDTLFIDEGFGSLDGDTLDVAMRTLDELRQGGRTVGVISHVEAMQEQIPAQLRVRATPEGPSIIEAR
ncbi:AAA family ATPase [Microbacterium oxydans]|uniref:Nuclease SbcCD subunit C n=1 Tax=Microbacterium oxydans TaxID=82380 RepID=A0A0F0LC60_9MICO|nr:SMC family ATPase [Microbacterium oxydans]KJL29156.1 Nuclease SbcCD subunit C [Microbacterium oxydans]